MVAIGASVLSLIVGGILVVPLRADLRITVKETFAGGTVTRVEYYKENCWRSDAEHGYQIVDSVNKRTITVDPLKREYSVNSFTSTPDQQIVDPSQTIVIEVESRDTGERRQLFGYPASLFVTIERQRIEHPDKPRPPKFVRPGLTPGISTSPFRSQITLASAPLQSLQGLPSTITAGRWSPK